MPNSKNRDRTIIIHHEKGAWWGHVYFPGHWCIVTFPQVTEVDALIASFWIIWGEFNG
jgi:hypothetical protein